MGVSHPCIFTFKVNRALNKLSVEISFHLRDISFLWVAKEGKQGALIAPQDTHVLIPESCKCCLIWQNGRCMAESSIVRWVGELGSLGRLRCPQESWGEELIWKRKDKVAADRATLLYIHKPVTVWANLNKRKPKVVIWSSAPWEIQLCSDHGPSPEWDEQFWRGDTLPSPDFSTSALWELS